MRKPDPRNIVSHFSPFFKLESLLKSTGERLIFPFYHAVNDKPGAHLRNLYSVKSVREFKKDLECFLKYYPPLSPEILLEKENPVKKEGFILSFDDGLREVHDIIAPILMKKGIPAIIFLNNNFIDNKDLFYRYIASLLIDKMRHNAPAKDRIVKLKESVPELPLNRDKLIPFILSLEYDDRKIIDQLCSLLNVDIQGYLEAEKPYMNSEEIFKLKEEGFFIGSHSTDHPEFYNLQSGDQFEEVKASCKDIRKRFGIGYNMFAFPFTDYGVGNPLLKSLHSDRELKPLVSFGTAGLKKATGLAHYQRIPMEKYQGNTDNVLKTEYLYFRLKKILGR